jgi:hypothetical protein
MDVRNFASTELFLRLLFVEFNPMMEPVSAAFSSEANFVPALSNWHAIEFDISPSALTAVPVPFLPVASPVRSLSNTVELRIFHNPQPFFAPGMNPAVLGNLGVDNITAAAIPEPSSWMLIGGGLLLAGLARLRVRQN